MKNPNNIRARLIELRGNKGRTDVAADLGITPQMLGAIERGDRTPSLPLAKKIADYYQTTVDSIFFAENRHDMFLKKLA
ncbi:helix-turn-helix domain-containing protein [Lysinibacillus louembei]|uniref:Helix-turn-helix domain-containing protein n=1 Tax=Lysinibacillus louembei TaxID=1470088 RepID=A0ABZ0RZI4_9BACI|nr:helix-turn-helix domain-containing protein [Lysinibacillus louembei]WPK12290.1 helix-turn-helix domain-containing protein [Lysinibacillus louembei]